MKFNHMFHPDHHTSSAFYFKSEDINVRLDFCENMVRVAIYHDNDKPFPTFSVCPDDQMPEHGRNRFSVKGFSLVAPKYTENPDEYRFEFKNLTVSVIPKNFEMSFFENGKLLFKDREYIAHNYSGELGRMSSHYVTREEDEMIFGLGDKTGDVNKNKRSFRLGTSDAMGFDARSSDPLYKHIPFYICENSVGSYGIYYDTYSDGEFDFGREINNYYSPFKSFKCEDSVLCYYCFFGDTKEILRNFSALTGTDMLPPEWTLKYAGSTMAYTDAPDTEKRLHEFIDKCKEYEIHPGGFYLSSGYTEIDNKRYVFNWNRDKIPSPEGLSAFFRENGIEFLPNIKPCFLTDHPLYKKIAENGWFLKDADGSPAVFPFWGGMGSYLDFTDPAAADFWTECVKRELVDKGYLSTWNDNNEYDINSDDVYACGFGNKIKAKLIKPLFSYLMTRASLAAVPDYTRKNAVSRCFMTGASRLASTWTGDNRTSFSDFRYNHKMAMTMSLSGIYNFGQDIGGFAGEKPSPELFLRWIQYGIFTPRFVLHSWNTDGSSNMPWLYPELKNTVTVLFKFREKFIPYLYDSIKKSILTHLPVIYPVFLNYPGYPAESDSFFFGDSILVTPVFDEGKTTVTTYLPYTNGGWYGEKGVLSLADGRKKFKKGEILATTEECTIYDKPIYYIKGGSIIRYPDMYVLYPLETGEFTEEFIPDDGISKIDLKNAKKITFHVKCDKKAVDVRIVNESGSELLPFYVHDRYERETTVREQKYCL